MLVWVGLSAPLQSVACHDPSLIMPISSPLPAAFAPPPRRTSSAFPLPSLPPTDALIKDINTDKLVAQHSSSRPHYASYASDPFFTRPSSLPPPESDPTAVRVKPGEKVDEGERGVKVDGERE